VEQNVTREIEGEIDVGMELYNAFPVREELSEEISLKLYSELAQFLPIKI
jgi:hypothetical protein